MVSNLLLQGILIASASAIPIFEQQPLSNGLTHSNAHTDEAHHIAGPSHGLHGRFLHITDFHPDPHYIPGTSSDKENSCHWKKGSSGYFGAEGTECDSPFSMVNETFSWIEKNLKGHIDFVVWTGDSARHDNDEKIPRSEDEVVSLNQMLAGKFIDVFKADNSPSGLSIPIVPTIGNNDIIPHNILKDGPNRWTKRLLEIWTKFIPEYERHTFVEGGWYTVEVIPEKLVVISLNTMYFFGSNSAVDGCEAKSEPGYEQMDWLRVQLKLLRERQVKAILMGHVPPARTDSKQNWDETCWQKYALWVHQYRDVIVGSAYGHMNVEHFMLQDSHDVEFDYDSEGYASSDSSNLSLGNISAWSRSSYLSSLREDWSKLPSPPSGISLDDWFTEDVTFANEDDFEAQLSKKKKKKLKKFLKKIDGPWAERYSLSLVSPSLVPNYFPSLRVVEYNITGLEDVATWAVAPYSDTHLTQSLAEMEDSSFSDLTPDLDINKKKRDNKKKKPKFKAPEPPSKSALPGPAYSNQPLTWLGYTQFFANLTRINDKYDKRRGSSTDNPTNVADANVTEVSRPSADDIFTFEVEYDTRNDDLYKLEDLTVRSFFKLASRIAENISVKDNTLTPSITTDDLESDKKGKEGKKPPPNRVWKAFLERAFVGFYDADDIDDS